MSSPRNEHGHRVTLGLEDGSFDVADVLAVHLHRQRPIANHLEVVGVVRVDEVAGVRPVAPAECVADDARDVAYANVSRGDEIQPAVEARLWREAKRKRPRVAVRWPIGDEREGGTPVPRHLEHGIQRVAMSSGRAKTRPRKGEIAGTAAVRAAPEIVDGTDDLGVEADTGAEAEATPVHTADADAARLRGASQTTSRLDRIA